MRALAFLVLLLFFSKATFAQHDELPVVKWYVPDFVTAQYAGSIGVVSAGVGYEILKHKANADLLFGYVPSSLAGERPLRTVTLKFTAEPTKIRLSKRTDIHPLTIGTYFSYTFGREFSSDLPSWYPTGYYWWSEAVRVNLFIGGNVRMASNRIKSGSRITAYYEIGTNEIKLVSYAQNKSALNIWSILHAGIGVKYHFAHTN